MRTTLMTALVCASALLAAPKGAEANPFYRHFRPWGGGVRQWFAPRIMFVPPMVAPVSVGPVYIAPPAPVYQQQYYYPPPPPPPVYVQPAPPPAVYVQPAPPPIYIQQPAPPPVYVQPAPPPPVYMQQPAPVYMQPPPPPVYMQQPAPPVYMQQPAPPAPIYMAPPAPAPVISLSRPPVLSQWKTRFGFGPRFAATINMDGAGHFSQLGIGGELLFRTHRRLVLELAGEYQKRIDNGFYRYDVPVTLGMRVHIGAPDWVVSPYFVFAGGAAYSNLDFLHGNDKAWFLDGQLGGGLEIRLGKHFAITADVRGDGRYRLTDPEPAAAATTFINGKPFAPMQNQYGAQLRLGAALYF